ncbi:MAG: tRNA-dihydrouridine synthase family protein [Leptospiraceae bacterium]|nr:tRNA-dihydrouridine synthase family protein [Leptospiraceae bacterium]
MGFWIREKYIEGSRILSPMAGVSDSPHRRITRNMGSAFSFTEFVSVEGILMGKVKTLDLFRFHESERPIWFQIFGNNPEKIWTACKLIEELNPDVIDLNMGCSVSKVAHKGSGAGLLKDPLKAGKIIEGMRKSVSLPITAKIRLGWDHSSLNYREVVHILEESGVDAISVHGRTKKMGYSGRADWEKIAEIKSFAKVPILGNGDISSGEEADFRLKESGVDAVLIGRGAIGNPWIFGTKKKSDLSDQERFSVILEHLKLMKEFYGDEYGAILFRKHLNKYLMDREDLNPLREKLIRSSSYTESVNLMSSYLYERTPIVK